MRKQISTGDISRSATRILDVLEAVLDQQPVTLTNTAHETGLTPTTTLRYLRALEARGYLQRGESDSTYTTGPTMRRLATSVHRGDPIERLLTAAQPKLEALASTTQESCYLAISDGTAATYVATAESSRAIRHVGWVGQNVPLDKTAAGAAFKAPGTVHVRTGVIEQDITAMSIALPPTPWYAAAISVLGPASRFTPEATGDIERSLIAATSDLCHELDINHTPEEPS